MLDKLYLQKHPFCVFQLIVVLMKKMFCSFAAVLAAFSLVLSRCNEVSFENDYAQDGNDLVNVMVNHSQHYAVVFQEIAQSKTKSGLSAGSTINVDVNALDDKFVDYIEMYTQPENVEDWNEESVLNAISNDSNFSYAEKVLFAQSIAFPYYVKGISNFAMTKVSPDDCFQQYKKANRRALKHAIVFLAIGLLEPTLAGETMAVATYVMEEQEAEADYYDCLAKAV